LDQSKKERPDTDRAWIARRRPKMQCDVLLVHPPSFYDFRERVSFPGPIARTVIRSTDQFVTIPFGMLSMAEYLDRNGFKVSIHNLGDRIVSDQDFAS
jgi:hypothetical protein